MGKVYLVGAGPGDPEQLTLKAARILAQADIVLHDSLVSTAVLQLVSPHAKVIDVGKRCGMKLLTQDEINSLLVSYAASHNSVVRLKGGDPTVFGRAGEEIEDLRKSRVDFEIVPGVTAALSAAAAAGISLTDRRAASQILITTFSRGKNANSMDWSTITSTTTMAIYMPGSNYADVSAWLREGGLPNDMPCVIVSHALSPSQQIRWSNISALEREAKLPAPALLIVGRVAAQKYSEIATTIWDHEIITDAAHVSQ